MRALRPIPMALLGQTCRVSVPADGTYAGEFEDPVEIGHVRFASRGEAGGSDHVYTDGQSVGVLFIDAANSEGVFRLPVGSMVEVEGRKCRAVKVEQLLGYGGAVHHWEVELA